MEATAHHERPEKKPIRLSKSVGPDAMAHPWSLFDEFSHCPFSPRAELLLLLWLFSNNSLFFLLLHHNWMTTLPSVVVGGGGSASTSMLVRGQHRLIQALFPRAGGALVRRRGMVGAYAPAIALSFLAWWSVFRAFHWPLWRWSTWYRRSLSEDERRFVRAYIVRSLWAVQAVYTALRVLGLLRNRERIHRHGTFTAERRDPVRGWSRV